MARATAALSASCSIACVWNRDVLHIASPWERAAVSAADAGLRLAARMRPRRSRPAPGGIRRILVLRLERIGDLLMSLPALHRIRSLVPDAEVDLVVGHWNRPLAEIIPGIRRLETMDAPWLSRGRGGEGFLALARRARRWRERRYDIAINLEGDIRSNVLLGLSGAAWKAGFGMAGGGPVLDCVVPFDPTSHTAVNGVRLVDAALGVAAASRYPPGEGRVAATALPRESMAVPLSSVAEAGALLGGPGAGVAADDLMFVGLHVGAGRAVKEWPASRLAAVAARLAAGGRVTIVLTGAEEDRATADALLAALPPSVPAVDLVGRLDMIGLAGVLGRLDLLITPDTGPMHLAGVLGVPLVGIFGPSSPERWGPLAERCRIVRIDLPCSPCNRLRTPPARCAGHTPDCLEAVRVDQVHRAACDLLAETSRRSLSQQKKEDGAS